MAKDFYTFRSVDYPYLIRAGPVNFNNVADYLTHMYNHFSWRKFKIVYQQEGQNVFDDFCRIMSAAIYYSLLSDSPNTTSDYFKLDQDADLGNILVTEIGNVYTGKQYTCSIASRRFPSESQRMLGHPGKFQTFISRPILSVC